MYAWLSGHLFFCFDEDILFEFHDDAAFLDV
jgi:hypothetical protein